MSRRKEPAIPNELLDQLLAGGDAGVVLANSGLLDALKKALTERALNAGIDHHLVGDDETGNSRNGYGRKTITTDTGKLAINMPRDRQASFDPQLTAKYQRRFTGFDESGPEQGMIRGIISPARRVDVRARREHPRDHRAPARSVRYRCLARSDQQSEECGVR